MNWMLIIGLGAAWLGWQIIWVASLPRQLRRGEKPQAPKGSPEAFMLFWVDQYAWLGLALLAPGLALALAGVVR